MDAIALQQLADVWSRRLDLQLWDIELRPADVDGGEIDEHTYMRTCRHARYQRAVILYASWLLDGGPARPAATVDVTMTDHRIEIVLVHELLHLYTGRLTDPLEDDLDVHLTPPILQVFMASLQREEEWVVDTLARALVNAFDYEA